jgi:aspartate carbamoyltransferase catalytic subunit
MLNLSNINVNGDWINWGPTAEVAEFHQKMFQGFLAQTPAKIREACYSEGRLVHILSAEHFDLSFLEKICEVTNAARRINKIPDAPLKKLLRNKSVLNYFAQPSSRTFNSFSAAESLLGMRREEVRDLRTSSAAKNENDRDALRTQSSYYDALVFRNSCNYFDLFALWVMQTSQRPIPIINAGAGQEEHPTQALLDYYTIRESSHHRVDGKSFAFVGDCKRGRTVHSLAKILALHEDIEIYFVAPDEYQIDTTTETYLQDRQVRTHKITDGLNNLPEIITGAVYMTRIQDEHDQDKRTKRYDPRFIFTEKMLDSLPKDTVLMHPLPKREEIEPYIDYRQDKNIMLWRQMRNGMWLRTALFAHIFGKDDKILDYYHSCKQSTAPKPL